MLISGNFYQMGVVAQNNRQNAEKTQVFKGYRNEQRETIDKKVRSSGHVIAWSSEPKWLMKTAKEVGLKKDTELQRHVDYIEDFEHKLINKINSRINKFTAETLGMKNPEKATKEMIDSKIASIESQVLKENAGKPEDVMEEELNKKFYSVKGSNEKPSWSSFDNALDKVIFPNSTAEERNARNLAKWNIY